MKPQIVHHEITRRLTALWFVLVILAGAPHGEARPRIGLALSGGGAKGLAHIGVLKVLEEKRIPVDCITGTSMGAIVGGLYAIGYDAERLETIAKTIGWNDLFMDAVSRRNLSMLEKEEDGKYAGFLPIVNRGVVLPSGLIAGQKMLALLNRLTWPVHEISDFSRFPIPFRCIAADIATGEAVVLDGGHLATAIRASMAIPSAFTPVELKGRLLVDGGIVRNLPASDARDMGGEFIIGVDIKPRQKVAGESQWSIVHIINQAANLVNLTTIAEQRAQCDILISPELENYNLFSFNAVDSLIRLGERAARLALASWDSLAATWPAFEPAPKRSAFPAAARSVHVSSIEVEGLHHASRTLVEGRLMLDLRSGLTAEDIDAAAERVYGSGFFQRVSYRLEGGEPAARLVIEVKERSVDEMRVGLHYDTENETSLLFNITLRNRLGHGSRQLIEARLGRFLGFRAAHSIDMGRNPGLAVGTEYRVQDWRMDAHENGRLAARYDMRLHEVNCRFEALASNSFSIGLGGFWRRIEKKPSWLPVHQEWSDASYHYGGFAAFFKMDNLDRLVYPYRGTRVRTEYRIVPDAFNDGAVFRQFDAFAQTVLPVASRLAVLADAQAGRIDMDKGTEEQTYRAGGLPGPGLNLIPFPGFEAMSRSGRAVAALKAGIRFEPRDLFFITAELGSLNTAEKVSDLFRGEKGEYCWDFSAGVLTPFGPLQWILSGSEKRNRPISWVSLGYVF